MPNQPKKEFVAALDAELEAIARQLKQTTASLEQRRQAVLSLRATYEYPSALMQATGFKIGPKATRAAYTPEPRPARTAMSTGARKRIAGQMKKHWQERKTAASTAGATNTRLTEGPAPGGDLSSIGMITRVLENAKGKPLSMAEILADVKTTFGVEAAKTSDQMLWRRANQKKGFYKTEDGRFGLTKDQAEIKKVEATPSALAS
jgi:hypothetical protein